VKDALSLNSVRCPDKDSFLGRSAKEHSLRLICGYSIIQIHDSVLNFVALVNRRDSLFILLTNSALKSVP